MIERRSLLGILAMALASSVSAYGGDSVELARGYFAEAQALSNADGGRLWGRPLYGPMLIVDPITKVIFANQDVPDAEDGGRLEAHDGVYVGPLPRDVMAANAAQDWRGIRWTTLLWQSIPRTTYRRRLLLAHELFHRIQPDLGLPSSSPSNPHMDDERGRFWLRMELRALGEALLREGPMRKSATRDALLFRATRHAIFPEAAETERKLELNEGLAQYTGFRLAMLPLNAVFPWVAQQILDRESQEGSDPIWMMRRMEGDLSPVSFSRTFPYMTGPAYALLLDGLDPAWRESAGDQMDLGARVAQGVGFSPSADLVAETRALAYASWIVRVDELERMDALRERQGVYRERLVEGPVLILPLKGRRTLLFKPTEVTQLPGVGQVYETLEAQATWGTLRVESAGALSHLHDNGNPRDIVLAGPPVPGEVGGTFIGDGWLLELFPGWEMVPGDRDGDTILHPLD